MVTKNRLAVGVQLRSTQRLRKNDPTTVVLRKAAGHFEVRRILYVLEEMVRIERVVRHGSANLVAFGLRRIYGLACSCGGLQLADMRSDVGGKAAQE